MATEKQAPKTVPVRALVDLPAHRAKCGQLAEVPADQLERLKADGQVDDHKDAVAYARKITPAKAEADTPLDV